MQIFITFFIHDEQRTKGAEPKKLLYSRTLCGYNKLNFL